jgi:hypothetical protein
LVETAINERIKLRGKGNGIDVGMSEVSRLRIEYSDSNL